MLAFSTASLDRFLKERVGDTIHADEVLTRMKKLPGRLLDTSMSITLAGKTFTAVAFDEEVMREYRDEEAKKE